ncbi:MAG TPA: hypothetical protein VG146_17695 [Verrucomicrobiae bacterium]|nr:hypothetical protein [Verrucomicrobiae bacterium]
MIAHDSDQGTNPAYPCANLTLTLDPLHNQGSDALAMLPADPFAAAKLCELEMYWDNSLSQVTTKQANDLFHPHGMPPGRIPKGANLTSASIHFQSKDVAQSFIAKIRPPHTISTRPATDTKTLCRWLQNHHFTLPPALAALFIALATAAAISPWPDTDDDDDDPPDDHRHSQFLPC